MKLKLSQIEEITLGAVRIEKNENGFNFYRFTEEQEELYKNRCEEFYMKSFSTSGVCMRFRTNSETLFLRVDVIPGSSRSYFAFDVLVNGEKIDTLDNFSDLELPTDYTKISYPIGEFSKEFELGVGEKEVCIYFPWSAKTTLKEIALDDDAFIQPIKPSKKILCFGDSITQGYDSLYPSSKYISRIANMLDAEEFNKAIGGEVFFAELAATQEDFQPDYITVAYGTNNWDRRTREEFLCNYKKFFFNLHNNYPTTPIWVITPIWRKDMNEDRPFGKFEDVEKFIESQVLLYENMTLVRGFGLVPQNENLFGDLRLHPNDKGFDFYFENLAKQIKRN